jgi:hypothetical protein
MKVHSRSFTLLAGREGGDDDRDGMAGMQGRPFNG